MTGAGAGARWTVLDSIEGLEGETIRVPGTVHHKAATRLKRAAQAARLFPTIVAARKNSGFLERRFGKDEIMKFLVTEEELNSKTNKLFILTRIRCRSQASFLPVGVLLLERVSLCGAQDERQCKRIPDKSMKKG